MNRASIMRTDVSQTTGLGSTFPNSCCGWVFYMMQTPAPVKPHHLISSGLLLRIWSSKPPVTALDFALLQQWVTEHNRNMPPPSLAWSLKTWIMSNQSSFTVRKSAITASLFSREDLCNVCSLESALFTNTSLCCSISILYKQLLEMQIYCFQM